MVSAMEEKRESERRHSEAIATFPLHLVGGCVAFERRHMPGRRFKDISVMDYISEAIKQEK
jgi:hypothetical protein